MSGSRATIQKRVGAIVPTLSALSLITLLVAATPALAQVERQAPNPWPAAPAVPQVALPTSHLVGFQPGDANEAYPVTGAPPQFAERGDSERFVTTAAAASVSSILGLYAGVALAYSHGGNEDLGDAFLGGGIGSSVGAATAAGLLNGNWGRTILGSMAGSVIATVVGLTVSEGSSDAVGLVAFGMTHGVVTTVLGGW